MTNEEKQKLLVALWGYMPYGVIVEHKHDGNRYNITTDTYHQFTIDALVVNFKPYLRPMSSMTEEEKKELGILSCEGNIEYPYGIFYRSQDWLNKKMFDYRGLIPAGLALPAKEGMYNE